MVFRIGFGLLMAGDLLRKLLSGSLTRAYVEPSFHFSYFGFDWLQPWPGEGIYWHCGALVLVSLCIAAGAFYRLMMPLFVLLFGYIFLLDEAQYLNHYYLILTLAVLMCFLPLHAACSWDAWRHRQQSTQVPYWTVWVLRFKLELVLIYAGLVKLNSDWLQLQPLGMWLRAREDWLFFGPWLQYDWVIAIGAYGVIALHLLGAPLLLWQRTRLWVLAIYAGFHGLNAYVFTIGVFPWLTLFASLLFCAPDWPLQAMRNVRAAMMGWERQLRRSGPLHSGLPRQGWLAKGVIIALVLWLLGQVLLPLRHLTYPGDVAWTEEGHRYAWRMKLRDKHGQINFQLVEPSSGQQWWLDQRDLRRYLTRRQLRKMATHPDMILQFAHYLERQWQQTRGITDVQVYAHAFVSLNGRPVARLIDQTVDLSEVPRSLAPAPWILPLTEPLPQEVGP